MEDLQIEAIYKRVSSRIRGLVYGFLFPVPRLFQGERCEPEAGPHERH